MKKVIVEAHPHVVIRGEIMMPDCLDEEEIAMYLGDHYDEIEYDWTPVECDFRHTDMNIIEIDGENVDIWQMCH